MTVPSLMSSIDILFVMSEKKNAQKLLDIRTDANLGKNRCKSWKEHNHQTCETRKRLMRLKKSKHSQNSLLSITVTLFEIDNSYRNCMRGQKNGALCFYSLLSKWINWNLQNAHGICSCSKLKHFFHIYFE